MARKTRKIKDKWKEKRWITVMAPDSFNNVPVAYVPITNDETAIGRVVEVTLFDILRVIHHSISTNCFSKSTK